VPIARFEMIRAEFKPIRKKALRSFIGSVGPLGRVWEGDALGGPNLGDGDSFFRAILPIDHRDAARPIAAGTEARLWIEGLAAYV